MPKNSLREVATAIADLFSRVPRTVLSDTLRTTDPELLNQAVMEELARKNNTVEINVTSARPLSDTIKQEIAEWIARRHKPRQTSVFYQLDPSLIGGIIIRTPISEIDLSVKNRLNKLS